MGAGGNPRIALSHDQEATTLRLLISRSSDCHFRRLPPLYASKIIYPPVMATTERSSFSFPQDLIRLGSLVPSSDEHLPTPSTKVASPPPPSYPDVQTATWYFSWFIRRPHMIRKILAWGFISQAFSSQQSNEPIGCNAPFPAWLSSG